MTRYLTFRERFDHRIHAIQEMNRVDHTPQSHSPNSRCRMKFTEKEDNKLVRFLAKMAPIKLGRSGNAIYKNVLVARVSFLSSLFLLLRSLTGRPPS